MDYKSHSPIQLALKMTSDEIASAYGVACYQKDEKGGVDAALIDLLYQAYKLAKNKEAAAAKHATQAQAAQAGPVIKYVFTAEKKWVIDPTWIGSST